MKSKNTISVHLVELIFLDYTHIIYCTVFCLLHLEGAASIVLNVLDFGAKGDGISLNTRAFQDAIDDCADAGGGTVLVPSGRFLTGTLILKSNVTLHVDGGSTIIASSNLEDFPIMKSKYQSYTGTYVTNKMLIYAEDAENIGVEGRGVINGSGDHWIDGPYGSPSFSVRPRILHFRGCSNIVVRDVNFVNSASWVQSYQACRNLRINGITVDSRENSDLEGFRYANAPGRNCDGMDIVDCQVVRISNCYINSGDDAIVIKSFSPELNCRDITISNCILSSHAAGIKIGTESAGGFQDIVVQNCTIFDTRGDGIALMTVDGGFLERITVSNVSLRRIGGAAIFVRLGARLRAYHAKEAIDRGELKDVLIKNVQGESISGYGCSITGLIYRKVENITLKDISLTFEHGDRILDKTLGISGVLTDVQREQELERMVPEKEQSYPGGKMFGRLPAYGFFIRHASGVKVYNVRLALQDRDIRPAIICEDVHRVLIRDLEVEAHEGSHSLIHFDNVQQAVLEGCSAVGRSPVFLSTCGSDSKSITLRNNLVANEMNEVKYCE